MSRRALIPLLVVLFVAAGCSLMGDDAAGVGASQAPEVSAVPIPSAVETSEPDAPALPDPTTEPEPEPATDPDDVDGEFPSFSELQELGSQGSCEYLGEEWCVDSNGNVWPDFVEEAVGRDASVDDCLRSDCAGPDLASFDLASLQENTLFVLDASGSMAGDAGGGQTKMEAAKAALTEYVVYTPEYADLGLVVYGHHGDNSDAGRPASCGGIDTFAGLGELTYENVEEVVGGLQPTGWTPIAAALDAAGPVVQAAAEADEAEGLEDATNRIILISDGIETCDGDPVASAQALVDLGINVIVDVVGFDIADSDRAALQQVAEVTGGVYADAADGAALREVLGQYDAQRVQVSEAMTCQVEAMSQAGICYSRLSQDARDHLFDVVQEEAEAAGDEERGTFIFEWTNVAILEAYAINEDNRLAMHERLEELRDLYDEAVERREEFQQGRNNKPIGRAVSFDCPFDDHPMTT